MEKTIQNSYSEQDIVVGTKLNLLLSQTRSQYTKEVFFAPIYFPDRNIVFRFSERIAKEGLEAGEEWKCVILDKNEDANDPKVLFVYVRPLVRIEQAKVEYTEVPAFSQITNVWSGFRLLSSKTQKIEAKEKIFRYGDQIYIQRQYLLEGDVNPMGQELFIGLTKEMFLAEKTYPLAQIEETLWEKIPELPADLHKDPVVIKEEGASVRQD